MTRAASRVWSAGAVTGIGSLPGTDPVEAAALAFGEFADLPFLPELPARGPGADMIGRVAALLVDLPVELVPSGWRITAHAGRDVRRARDLLAWDLDALDDAAAGYAGPLKTQCTGPWTLAAQLELPNGHKVVSDHGATRDLAASLVEGIAAHLASVAARVPGAVPVLQLDEPGVPAVLDGRVPTPSGYGTLRAVDVETVEAHLRDVLAAAAEGGRIVHSCAADAPIALFRAAGADAISLDPALLDKAALDAVGEAVDAGVALWLGVLPGTDTTITLDSARGRVERLWDELGFARAELASTVVATPTCGFAGASTDYVRRACDVLRDVGRWLVDQQ